MMCMGNVHYGTMQSHTAEMQSLCETYAAGGPVGHHAVRLCLQLQSLMHSQQQRCDTEWHQRPQTSRVHTNTMP